MPVRQILGPCFSLAAFLAVAFSLPVHAQDTRNPTEPTFPTVCTQLAAASTVTSGVPTSETLTSTSPDTARIQSALSACANGKAVELTANGANVAFLSGPLYIPSGVTLIVDGGVTLFASRNPADFQASGAQDTCGVNGTHGDGCNPFLVVGESSITGTSTSTGSGLMGYGVINGRGNEKLIAGGALSAKSWWDLSSDARTGPNTSQNNPILVQLYKANSSIIYKITLLNSPKFHVKNQYSTGFTVWGLKLLTPWTARNTDGVDPTGTTNMTVANSVISDGDDEIAISGSTAATGFSFTNLQLTSGHGVSIGSYTSSGVSNVLANGLYFNGQAADSNQEALHIKSAKDRGGLVNNITYQNVCIRNVKNPIDIDPFYNTNSGTSYPQYTNLTFRNVHVLTEGNVTLQGYSVNYPVTMTFDNLVFDTLVANDINNAVTQTAGAYNPQFLTITLANQTYPALLQSLNNTTTFPHSTGVTYTGSATTTNASAFSCTNVFATLATEMFASTATANSLQSATITNPAPVTLNAVIEPTTSQVSYTDPNTGSAYTGAFVPTGSVQFLEGSTVVGTGTFVSNGTLASTTLSNLTAGSHTYTARYVGDSHYAANAFGSVTVTVTAGPASQLAFASAPPSSLTYGNSPGAVTVAVRDAAGNATTSTATVTLQIVNNSTSATQNFSANAVSGTATFNLSTVLPAGTYTYTAASSGLASATAGETVNKATATVTANPASRIFDAPNPAFTYTFSNFVNGDDASVVSGVPVLTTAAARNAAPGNYPINVALGTLTAANYNFTLVGGIFTVNGGAAQSVLFSPLPNFPQGATYQLTARTTSGLAPAYTVFGPASISGGALTVTGPGTVTVTAANAGNGSYAAASGVTQTFTAQ